jgi:hypothetical protein
VAAVGKRGARTRVGTKTFGYAQRFLYECLYVPVPMA